MQTAAFRMGTVPRAVASGCACDESHAAHKPDPLATARGTVFSDEPGEAVAGPHHQQAEQVRADDVEGREQELAVAQECEGLEAVGREGREAAEEADEGDGARR